MNKYPEISIIIPTYNNQGTIKKTIHSVLNQSFTNFEIIVVDNGSTDGTKTIIKSIKDKRIKYFHRTKNYGAASARNYGARKAKSDLLNFLDSDDLFLDNFLSTTVSFLNKYKAIDGIATGVKINARLHDYWHDRICNCIPINKVIRKNIFFVCGGFNENIIFKNARSGEDTLLNKILFQYFNILKIKNKLVEYTIRKGNFIYKNLEIYKKTPLPQYASLTKMSTNELLAFQKGENLIKKCLELTKQKIRHQLIDTKIITW